MLEKYALYRSGENGAFSIPLFGEADSYFEKVAEPQLLTPVIKYIEGLRPREDSQYVLTNAMGASEYFSSNINGDAFFEPSLLHVPEGWSGNPVVDKIKAKDWPYGYPTFYYAHAFGHHKNKDASKAYGDVELAAWNDRMKRVELVIRLDKDKCEKFGGTPVWDRLKAGQFPDVSMGCFTAGNCVTMADGTRKPIEKVKVGDFVITHLGRARMVTEVHKREYLGALYKIRAKTHKTITATRQHPFWCVKTSQVKARPTYTKWRKSPSIRPKWVDAENLDNHYLLEPVLQEVKTPGWVNKEFCRILGYYLASGYILWNGSHSPIGVGFKLPGYFDAFQEIRDLCKKLRVQAPVVWCEPPGEEGLKHAYILDRCIAESCFMYGGHGDQKKFSSEALRWSPEFQKEIFEAHFAFYGGALRDSIRIFTRSKPLAHQWLVILPRLGLTASVEAAGRELEVLPDGDYCAQEWAVTVSRQEAQGVIDTSNRVGPMTGPKKRLPRRIFNGYVVTPIDSLGAETSVVDVYNLEVAEDASYLVEGLAVHNCRVPFDRCSICADNALFEKALKTFDPKKHKHPGIAVLEFHKKLKADRGKGIRGIAVTRAEYCEHASKQMNRILEDGRKVFVHNDFPRFFDISFVFVGADKTAKVMLKLAGENQQGENVFDPIASMFSKTASIGLRKKAYTKKKAEIEKNVVSQLSESAIPVLTRKEPTLPKEVLDNLCEHPLASTLSTASRMGIVLKPKEFQRIILVRMGNPGLADQMDARNLVFPRVPESSDLPLGLPMVSDIIQRILQPFMRDRSCLPPAFSVRITRTTIIPDQSEPPCPCQPSGLLCKISSAYNGYRNQVMQLLPIHSNLAASHSTPGVKEAQSIQGETDLALAKAYVQKAYWDEVVSF